MFGLVEYSFILYGIGIFHISSSYVMVRLNTENHLPSMPGSVGGGG